ncbi:MAG: RNA-directed DNA polymerase [Chloroflexota bacterium]|nr:RNA-directed DNA polymerase [Chloroflexota bacterium]
MTLHADSIHWAIESIGRHSDGDIFPSIPEFSAVFASPKGLIDELSAQPIGDYEPQPCRRFIVPKDDLSFRQATQLHPQDSLILTAVIYQYGSGIEARRLPDDIVFSYRFNPDDQYRLYGSGSKWNEFWMSASEKSKNFSHVLYCDITDFYNQIYHHVVENQLISSGFQNQALKWVRELLSSTTQGVSRGLPIGPHGAHLLAESTMIPIDNSLKEIGLQFLRFSDDMVFFCDSEQQAKRTLRAVATTLDKQQRLQTQRHKTKVFCAEDFRDYCLSMVEDRPISLAEDRVLNVIRKYSGGNPYAALTYNQISSEDWKQFSEVIIAGIIQEYLQAEEVDHVRLRWFFRRLAQVGHPAGLEVVLTNIEQLEPSLPRICSYISSVKEILPEDWEWIGAGLCGVIDSPVMRDSEFARIAILSLFSRNELIDNFVNLAQRFNSSDAYARREILLAARINGAADWLRQLKEDYAGMDRWQQMAFVYCSSILPEEERRYFLNRQRYNCPFEDQLMKLSRDTN